MGLYLRELSATKDSGEKDMIDTRKGACRFVCDRCELEFPEDGEFHEVLEAIKSEGWKVSNLGGDWMHFCPDCVFWE